MSAAIEATMTVGALLAAATARLDAAGLAAPRREARLVLALALGVDPAAMLGWPERAVDPEKARAAEALLQRRARREPLSRLAGHREFWSLDFALSPDTLDPRPDSETLIAAALADIPDRAAPLRVVDLGTGTGCLLLALLSELPHARGIGVDIAPGAITTARGNAARLGLANRAAFQLGGWGSRIAGPADVILTNPPYIPCDEIAALPPEVLRYDPVAALDGGPDGLAAYRVLGPAIRDLLSAAGKAYVELGAGQVDQVARLMAEAGLRVAAVKRDLAGIERCLIATL
jgi:release factor glutamine methyltransferase